ncbi:hypothetical protein PVAP13_2KG576777 [Panicum virgatum]|uniref:Secreted protein n=1 Tax=Panicum virgatum TaxID=38727 RepID=A0A8T0WHA6_PANVG|nr:hypothetical protein PVAP13_2KG576777 [Panicum virgatum]
MNSGCWKHCLLCSMLRLISAAPPSFLHLVPISCQERVAGLPLHDEEMYEPALIFCGLFHSCVL